MTTTTESITTIIRYMRDDIDDCIHWPHALTGSRHAVWKGRSATRVIWVAMNGPLDPSLVIRHTCHVADCVNPLHLTTGTPAENSRDMVLAGRSLKGHRNPSKRPLRTPQIPVIRTAASRP